MAIGHLPSTRYTHAHLHTNTHTYTHIHIVLHIGGARLGWQSCFCGRSCWYRHRFVRLPSGSSSHLRHPGPAVPPAPLAGACSLFVLIFQGKKMLLLYPRISVMLSRQYLLPPWLVRVLCFSLFVLNQRQEAPVSVSAKLRHAELAVPLAPLAGVCLG